MLRNKMVVPSWRSGFTWRTKITSWSHTLWLKWACSNNNMGEFDWRKLRRNYVFVSEYFLKDFYGLKLPTTRATIASSKVTTYMEFNKQLKNCLNLKICCPEVIPVTLDVFPGCANIVCGRPVVVCPDQLSTSWQQYSTTMKVSKSPCIFHCSLTFKDMEKLLNLTPEVLKIYLKQDVIKLCSKENIKSFKDSLLFIEKVDYFYNYKNLKPHMKKILADIILSLNFTYKIYFLETYYI